MKTKAATSYDELDEGEKVDASYLAGAFHAFTTGHNGDWDDPDDDHKLMIVEAANWMRAGRVLGYVKPKPQAAEEAVKEEQEQGHVKVTNGG